MTDIPKATYSQSTEGNHMKPTSFWPIISSSCSFSLFFLFSHFWSGIPEILSNLGNLRVVHCGILVNRPYWMLAE